MAPFFLCLLNIESVAAILLMLFMIIVIIMLLLFDFRFMALLRHRMFQLITVVMRFLRYRQISMSTASM